ncbi:MAG: sulfotransferase [Gammaproteobacteria bacterium]|nr:sulfotransferase [Gammaproteobacteria bacterium]
MRFEGREWSRDWRLLSSPFRRLPDFLIAGEAKCGTTSLFRYLEAHPRVVGAVVKETNSLLLYPDSLLALRAGYPFRWTHPAARWRAGEASPEYFSRPGMAARVHRHLPDARVIVLLRDPVQRAFSDFRMLEADAGAQQFAEQVQRSLALLAQDDFTPLIDALRQVEHHPLRYVLRGIYHRPMGEWLKAIPPAQLLVLGSEELFARPAASMARVLAFLGLSNRELPEYPVKKGGRNDIQMDPVTREQLREFFSPHNQRLFQMLGTDFAWESGTAAS